LPQKDQPVQVVASAPKAPKSLPNDGLYTVRRGDSLHRIAKRYGVSQQQILALNDIRRANRIYPGQVIRVAPISDVAEQPAPDKITPAEKPVVAVKKDKDAIPATANTAADDTTVATVDNKIQDLIPKEKSATDATPDSAGEEQQLAMVKADSETDLPKLPPIVDVVPPLPEMVANPDANDAQEAQPEINMEDVMEEGQLASLEPSSIAAEAEQENRENIELAADPTDYSVAGNNTIEVQAAETLGHYAEWLNLRASQLRRINRMRYGKPVVIGKRIKLDFSRVTHDEFERQRKEYHRAIQEEFFDQFEITGSEKHVIRRGESIWKLTKRKYKIPIWLLRQYNPDLSINNVRPGTVVTFPQIEERSNKEAASQASDPVVAVNN
jgi:membrane-bound lytic murein transglycosylase D